MHKLFKITYEDCRRVFHLRRDEYPYNTLIYGPEDAKFIMTIGNSSLRGSIPNDKRLIVSALWFEEEIIL